VILASVYQPHTGVTVTVTVVIALMRETAVSHAARYSSHVTMAAVYQLDIGVTVTMTVVTTLTRETA